jgi:phosphoesterase RecJ-like protein
LNTLRVAASIIDLGADSKYIYDNIYIETLAVREMKNYFASKIQMRDGVAWLVNKGDVFDKFHCEFNDVSRGMLSLMVGIEEIKI